MEQPRPSIVEELFFKGIGQCGRSSVLSTNFCLSDDVPAFFQCVLELFWVLPASRIDTLLHLHTMGMVEQDHPILDSIFDKKALVTGVTYFRWVPRAIKVHSYLENMHWVVAPTLVDELLLMLGPPLYTGQRGGLGNGLFCWCLLSIV